MREAEGTRARGTRALSAPHALQGAARLPPVRCHDVAHAERHARAQLGFHRRVCPDACGHGGLAQLQGVRRWCAHVSTDPPQDPPRPADRNSPQRIQRCRHERGHGRPGTQRAPRGARQAGGWHCIDTHAGAARRAAATPSHRLCAHPISSTPTGDARGRAQNAQTVLSGGQHARRTKIRAPTPPPGARATHTAPNARAPRGQRARRARREPGQAAAGPGSRPCAGLPPAIGAPRVRRRPALSPRGPRPRTCSTAMVKANCSWALPLFHEPCSTNFGCSWWSRGTVASAVAIEVPSGGSGVARAAACFLANPAPVSVPPPRRCGRRRWRSRSGGQGWV